VFKLIVWKSWNLQSDQCRAPTRFDDPPPAAATPEDKYASRKLDRFQAESFDPNQYAWGYPATGARLEPLHYG
jgi:hypothetical protein